MRISFFYLKIFSLLFCFGSALTACSPAPDDELGKEENSNYGDENMGEPDADVSAVDDLRQSGWRPGTMTMNFVVDQAGELTQETAESGGTRTHVEWKFNLNANQTWKILVAPDLSVLIPETSSPEELRSAFGSEPIYIDDLESLPEPGGQVIYSKRLAVSSPNANEYTSLTEVIDATGNITDFRISNLKPSIFGEGYEMVLDLGYSLVLTATNTAHPVKGPTERTQEERPVNEQMRMHFFPIPNIAYFNRYPFEQLTEVPVELRDAERQNALEVLKALEATMASATVIGDLRPGLQRQATKDELKLLYSNANNLPLFVDIAGLAMPTNPNLIRIEIVIKASP